MSGETELYQGQLVKCKRDIIEGIVVYAEKGDYGEVVKKIRPGEYIVHMARRHGLMLKLNTNQIEGE